MTLTEAIAAVRAGEKARMVRCPAHMDNTASLKVDRGEKVDVVLYCHAGCSTADVLAAAGLTMKDLMADRPPASTKVGPHKWQVAAYDYCDESGARLFQSVRFAHLNGKKSFQQRRPDGNGGWVWNLKGVRKVLFGLPALQGQRIVIVAEGEKDVLELRKNGFVATTNPMGAGKWCDEYTEQLIAAGVRQVVVIPDDDAAGHPHADTVARSCLATGLDVKLVPLPAKDVSDWLSAGGTRDELLARIDAVPPFPPRTSTPARPVTTAPTCDLAEVNRVFRKWLGKEYDLDAINAVVATAAAERLDGDPLWLLLVSGSGNAKTETVQALELAGAIITSTISSEGALLSGTAKKEQARDATGGLLRLIGPTGVLVIKDVTSILSMDRNARGGVLAALREVHDGRWQRNVGTDGGRTLSWKGRIAVIGAVTTQWDRCHDVIAAMGDRFVVIRVDSTTGRQAAGRRAMQNTGDEIAMRRELADAVAGVLANVNPKQAIRLTDDESERLLAAADVVTRCRTGVEYDNRGDVIDAHAPEMPTRFAKELVQVVRGAVAVGLDRTAALRLALRCARDSMPPLRLAILLDVAAHPGARTGDVRRRIDKPWSTVDRQLQALHMLGVLTVEERQETDVNRKPTVGWHYFVAAKINPAVLATSPDLLLHANSEIEKREGTDASAGEGHLPTHISGDASAAASAPPATEAIDAREF